LVSKGPLNIRVTEAACKYLQPGRRQGKKIGSWWVGGQWFGETKLNII